jgi:hypothetical protein
MTREQAIAHVSHVADDALSFRRITPAEVVDSDTIVVFEDGDEVVAVAGRSYLPNVVLTEVEATELAQDGLLEAGNRIARQSPTHTFEGELTGGRR